MHHFSCYDFFSPGSSIFIFKQFLLARVTGSIIFAFSSLLCCHWQSVNQQNECDEYVTPAAVVYDSKSPKPEATYEICYYPFLFPFLYLFTFPFYLSHQDPAFHLSLPFTLLNSLVHQFLNLSLFSS